MTDTTTAPATAKSNLSVLAKFFGRKPGQNLREFAAEVKELTEEDQAQLAGGITDGTLTY